MLTILMGVFLLLHGLVHLLYAGQSGRLFELRPGMTWPDGSWAFSKLLGVETIRQLGVVVLALAALGLFAGGLGLILRQDWGRPAALAAAALSAAIFVLMWDGRLQVLHDKGAIGVLLDLAILAAVLVLRWPG
jgi:hypothetical protein